MCYWYGRPDKQFRLKKADALTAFKQLKIDFSGKIVSPVQRTEWRQGKMSLRPRDVYNYKYKLLPLAGNDVGIYSFVSRARAARYNCHSIAEIRVYGKVLAYTHDSPGYRSEYAEIVRVWVRAVDYDDHIENLKKRYPNIEFIRGLKEKKAEAVNNG